MAASQGLCKAVQQHVIDRGAGTVRRSVDMGYGGERRQCFHLLSQLQQIGQEASGPEGRTSPVTAASQLMKDEPEISLLHCVSGLGASVVAHYQCVPGTAQIVYRLPLSLISEIFTNYHYYPANHHVRILSSNAQSFPLRRFTACISAVKYCQDMGPCREGYPAEQAYYIKISGMLSSSFLPGGIFPSFPLYFSKHPLSPESLSPAIVPRSGPSPCPWRTASG